MLLWIALTGLGCGDAAGPTRVPTLQFVSGNAQTDTVGAMLPKAVVAEVRDSNGNVASSVLVRYTPLDSAAMQVATISGALAFGGSAMGTTDSEGRSAVFVRLGGMVGSTKLRAWVPTLGIGSTAQFTVEPGASTRILVEPADTAVIVGAVFNLRRSTLVDRLGHLTGDSVLWESLDAAAIVSNTGTVTGVASGSARIVARVDGGPADTARVAIWPPLATLFPEATIAASVHSGVAVFNLDGSDYREFPVATAGYQGRHPSWLGDSAVAAMDGDADSSELIVVSMDGTVHYLLQETDSLVLEVWPESSRDGAWIYFGGLGPGIPDSEIAVWRVRPDGSGLERISPPKGPGEADTQPSPSPDGTRVAVATTRFDRHPSVAVIDVVKRQLVDLGVEGTYPRWSPTTDSIAFVSGAEIWLASSWGEGARRVSLPGHGYGELTWSPDGKWLIATRIYYPVGLELVEVATGQSLPLPDLPRAPKQPAWRW
jgi:hypothetical protein